MDRSNPYEAAFEAYLQRHGLCHVAVDETRRALWGQTSIKSLDFIVLGENGARLLVDVKGRRFPGGAAGRERYVWENWSTLGDIDGLTSWTRLFGAHALALFVFLYRIEDGVTLEAETPDLWSWRGQRYLLRAVSLEQYRRHMKVRSPKWGTVFVPKAVFHDLARPFRYWSHLYVPEALDPYGPDADWFIPEMSEPALAGGAGPGPEARDLGR